MKIKTNVDEIPYEDAYDVYKRTTAGGKCVSLLMESRSKDLRYGRQSIIVPNPAIQFTGHNRAFEVKALNELGASLLDGIKRKIRPDEIYAGENSSSLLGSIKPAPSNGLSEIERLRKPSLASIIRAVMQHFETEDGHAGLYGAFSYDFARQFENIGDRFSIGNEPDFNLFIPSEVLVFDDIRQRAFRKRYFGNKEGGQVMPKDAVALPMANSADMTLEEFMKKTAQIIEAIKQGELIQCILSRTESMNLKQPPLESYAALRRINPSPYCFFFNFGGGDYLFGASPELHVSSEGRNAEIRPLAGTIGRKGNAISDHYARIQLLNDFKEQREHTMLVDLARNDIGRVCNSVNVYEYMAVEEYPNLYHLGSGVKGILKNGMDGLDCIVATLPAGTLSGAPKVRAMQMIEELEGSRRGYYGGCIGYLGFNGNCNTGITIRSVYVHEGRAYVRAGAGIVRNSVPEKELAEVELKNANQIKALGGAQ